MLSLDGFAKIGTLAWMWMGLFALFFAVMVWKALHLGWAAGKTTIYPDAIVQMQGKKEVRLPFAEVKHYGIQRKPDGEIVAIDLGNATHIFAKRIILQGVLEMGKIDEVLAEKMPALHRT